MNEPSTDSNKFIKIYQGYLIEKKLKKYYNLLKEK